MRWQKRQARAGKIVGGVDFSVAVALMAFLRGAKRLPVWEPERKPYNREREKARRLRQMARADAKVVGIHTVLTNRVKVAL